MTAAGAQTRPPSAGRTIGTRALLVLLVVLAVLPGVGVVVYGYLAAQREAVRQAQIELQSVAALVAANQAAVVQNVRQILGTVTSGPSVRRDDLRPLCREFLRNIVNASPGYSNLALANLQGEVICQGHADNTPVNVADRRYFRKAIETRDFAVGRHVVGRITGQSVLGFGLPVYDDGNRFVGVAFATMDLGLANLQLRQIALPGHLQVHVLDVEETVLVSTGDGSWPVGTHLRDTSLRDVLRQGEQPLQERRDGAGALWFDRVTAIGSDVPHSLRLVVSARQSDILNPALSRLRGQLAALGLATLLGMLAAGWLSERQFARPVSQLLKRMRRAAADGAERADSAESRSAPGSASASRSAGAASANRELQALHAEFSRTLQTLRSQQEQLVKAQTIARVGFYVLDVASQRYTVSSIVFEIFGLDPAKGCITVDEYTALIHPDDLPTVLAQRAKLMSDLQPLRLQYRIVRPDGELRWVDIFGFIDQASEGRAVAYTGAIQDVTEGQRLRRLLEVQSQINAAIVRAGDAAALYAEACRIVVAAGQMRMAWVGALEPGTGQLQILAQAGHEDGYLPLVLARLAERQGPAADTGNTGQTGGIGGIGNIGDISDTAHNSDSPALVALRLGRLDTCNDLATDPRMAPWREAAVERGYRAAAALPLKDEGRTVAALMFMAGEKRFFQDEELRLLEAIGESLSLALTRLRTEASMQTLNRRMTNLLASTSDGFVAFDRAWRYTQVNEQAARFVNLPPESLLGKTYLELFPDAVGSPSHVAFTWVMQNRTAMNFETHYAAWDRWFENRVFPTDEGISVFFQDITERKSADQRLLRQLARTELLGAITRAIEERLDLQGIFQVLADSLQTQLPATFCAVALRTHAAALEVELKCLGAGSGTLAAAMALSLGMRVSASANGLSRCLRGELVHEADLTGLDFELPRRLLAGGLRSAVLAPLALDGEVFGLILVARAEAQAFSSGDCEFLHQLSEHVALAAHQARLYEDLQQAYERLQRSQQVVLQQERLRALGQMASGVAHDINNAVSPVALYTESLLETEPGLSGRTRRYLQTIQRAIDDVTHTVTRMREFSRERDPGAGLVAVQLNTLVPQVLELTRARWRDMPQQAGIVIDVDSGLQPDLPEVLATEGEIREALTNLVFNAVDAMPHGGRLRLGTARHVGPVGIEKQAEVALSVSDTGLGMDETTRRRCLEPFFTTKGERGTGLGLAMVYGTVQRHGGRIEIDSAPGQGTTVRLLFPVQAPSSLQALPPVPAPAPALQVLLIDDDALLLDSLGEILRGEGHQVQVAMGGQAGIDALRQAAQTGARFDVVITDLGMPTVDGTQVAREAKALNPATPVVMLTGWGRRMSDDDERPAHVDLLMSKPPRLAELRAMAQRFGSDVSRA